MNLNDSQNIAKWISKMKSSLFNLQLRIKSTKYEKTSHFNNFCEMLAQNFTKFYYQFKKKGLQTIELSYYSFPLEITRLLDKLTFLDFSFKLPPSSSSSIIQRNLNPLSFFQHKSDSIVQLDKEILSLEKKVNSIFLMLNDQEIKGHLDGSLAYLLNSDKIFLNQELTQNLPYMKDANLSNSLPLEKKHPSSSSFFYPLYFPPFPSSFPSPTLQQFPPPSSFRPHLSTSFHVASSSLSPSPPFPSLSPSKPIGYHSDIINVVCFITELNCVASAGGDHFIKFWNLKVKQEERKEGGGKEEDGEEEEGKDKGWRAIGEGKNEKYLKSKVGTLIFELRAHSGDIWDLVYYNNKLIERLPQFLLFSASSDQIIKLWDLTKKICLKNFIGHLGIVRTLALVLKKKGNISQEACKVGGGEEWVEGGDGIGSGAVSIGGKAKGEEVQGQENIRGRRWEEDQIRRKKNVFSLLLYSGGSDSTIRSWDIISGDCLGGFKANSHLVRCLILNPHRPHILSGGGDPFLYVFEIFPKMKNIEVILAVEGKKEEGGCGKTNREKSMNSMEKREKEEKLVKGGVEGGRMRESRVGEEEEEGDIGEEEEGKNKRRDGQMWSLIGIGKMNYIVSTGSDRSIKIWSALNYRLIRCIEAEHCLNRVIFIGKGRVAASASDGSIEVWRIEQGGGRERRGIMGEGVLRREDEESLKRVRKMVVGLSWEEDKGVVSGGWDGMVRLWNDL